MRLHLNIFMVAVFHSEKTKVHTSVYLYKSCAVKLKTPKIKLHNSNEVYIHLITLERKVKALNHFLAGGFGISKPNGFK